MVVRHGEVARRFGRLIVFHEESGEVSLRNDEGDWICHVPISEGRPLLKGGRLIQGRWNDGTLALLMGFPSSRSLHVFEVAGTLRSLSEHVCPRDANDFALSRDGRRVAWRLGDCQLMSQDVGEIGRPSLVTPKGRAHPNLGLELGLHFLTIKTGRYRHLIRWDRGRLEFALSSTDVDTMVERSFGWIPPWIEASGEATRHAALADPRRFNLFAVMPPMTAAVDRYGQVVILDQSGEVVCMFLAFREKIAAWAPDGTRVGPVPMHVGPPTPGGEERIAAFLLAAGTSFGRNL